MNDIVERLRCDLAMIEPIPDTCEGFRGRQTMEGTAFFPGGDGLWKSDPGATVSFPYGGVLALGSDFGDSESYDERVERRRNFPQELDGRTWPNLLKLMERAGIGRQEFFFTNAWPCMRKGCRGVGGSVPAARDTAFTDRCCKFFHRTRELMRPRLIVPLGLAPAAFLAKAYGTAPTSLGTARSWRQIDSEPIWRTNDSVIVPIVHPSMPNRRHRREANTEKREAELIKRALRQALATASGISEGSGTRS